MCHASLRVQRPPLRPRRALVRWGPKRRGKTLIFKVKQDFEMPDWLEAWARIAQMRTHLLYGGFSGCSVGVGRGDNRTLVEQTWWITQKSGQARKAARLVCLKFTWVLSLYLSRPSVFRPQGQWFPSRRQSVHLQMVPAHEPCMLCLQEIELNLKTEALCA